MYIFVCLRVGERNKVWEGRAESTATLAFRSKLNQDHNQDLFRNVQRTYSTLTSPLSPEGIELRIKCSQKVIWVEKEHREKRPRSSLQQRPRGMHSSLFTSYMGSSYCVHLGNWPPYRTYSLVSKREIWKQQRQVKLERLRGVGVIGNQSCTCVWTLSKRLLTAGRGVAGE